MSLFNLIALSQSVSDAFKTGAGFSMNTNKMFLLGIVLCFLFLWLMYFVGGKYKEYQKNKEADKFYQGILVVVCVVMFFVAIYFSL